MTEYNITKAQAHRLYQTMKDIHDIFLKNKIDYWVTGGTLLGAIRHNGIVPWDDDGDICIMKKDVPRLRKLVSVFAKKRYKLEEGTTDDEEDAMCVKKKDSCTWYLESNLSNSLGVDIFVMERIGPLVTYSDPYWRTSGNGGKRCFFLYSHLYPLKPVPFGNFWVMAPHNAFEHLNQCYGTDWASRSQRLFDHRLGKWVNSKLTRMLPADFGTIPAPKSTYEPNAPKLKGSYNLRPSKGSNDLTNWEVHRLASLFKIKNRSNLTIEKKKKIISEIV